MRLKLLLVQADLNALLYSASLGISPNQNTALKTRDITTATNARLRPNKREFNPTLSATRYMYGPKTSFTERSEDTAYTLGPKGLCKGCRVFSSRSIL